MTRMNSPVKAELAAEVPVGDEHRLVRLGDFPTCVASVALHVEPSAVEDPVVGARLL